MADGTIGKMGVSQQLTPKQIGECKDELVEVDTNVNRIRSEKQAANAKFSEELKPLVKRQKELLKAIATGSTEVEMEVREDWDIAAGVVRFIDPKTGKVVGSREMSPDEEDDATQNPPLPNTGPVARPRSERGRRRRADQT